MQMNDMQRYLVEEVVEDYEEGRLSRRELLRRVTLMTGSAVVAGTFLAAARPPAAAAAPMARPAAQMTSPTDPDLEVGMVDYPGQGATLQGYLARPKGDQARAAIVLMHENQGQTPHQQDVARRLAKEGYVALAVDMLSRQGGTAAFREPGTASAALAQLPPEQMVGDLSSTVTYLQSLPYVRASSIGATGQCFGGGIIWWLATANPNLKAAVPFYGAAPPLDAVPNIQAAVLGIYAGEDTRINATIPDLVAALTAAGKTFEIEVYPGVQHAFFNDTGDRYNADAARAAWQRALGWFNTYLNA
jgi:carboxymethylenebutenolidase